MTDQPRDNRPPEGPRDTVQRRRHLPHRHCRPQFNESVAADAAALAAREETFWQLVRRVLCQVEDGYTTEATAMNAVREAAETYKVAFPEDAERFAREEGGQTVQFRHLQRAMQARDERASENPPQ
ncbi:hypothetical protein DIS24_g1000 [Lasiodiplodia hormozganensis]|uniref:Core Histone H2A/H2B/H3 domain-containing protein n=1 Tax=Lasiodiplodia hormozganensis TaxID=869390 RepID=A0AA39Z464_9PEZI|nr:hypothetical protein DIS24_g1000 [Lasiodiplodia hormozganensis]